MGGVWRRAPLGKVEAGGGRRVVTSQAGMVCPPRHCSPEVDGRVGGQAHVGMVGIQRSRCFYGAHLEEPMAGHMLFSVCYPAMCWAFLGVAVSDNWGQHTLDCMLI